MTGTKARKGDLIAWEVRHTTTYLDRPATTTANWRLGIVTRATRDGVAVTATELGYNAPNKVEHCKKLVVSHRNITIDIEAVATDYRACNARGSYRPLVDPAAVKDLVRPHVVGLKP